MQCCARRARQTQSLPGAASWGERDSSDLLPLRLRSGQLISPSSTNERLGVFFIFAEEKTGEIACQSSHSLQSQNASSMLGPLKSCFSNCLWTLVCQTLLAGAPWQRLLGSNQFGKPVRPLSFPPSPEHAQPASAAQRPGLLKAWRPAVLKRWAHISASEPRSLGF